MSSSRPSDDAAPRDVAAPTRILSSRPEPPPLPVTPAPAPPLSPPTDLPPTDLQRWARLHAAEPRVALAQLRPHTASDADPSRYHPEAPLGQGGVGDVDLVFDRDLRRHVARKRLRHDLREDPTLVRAFLEEAIITGALEHPNIVPIHDIGATTDGGPWYTMKRHVGEPLSSILSRLRQGDATTQRTWPLPRLVDVFLHVLRAISHAHANGVIHCDLKPANILVGPLGEVLVVDWGLAKVLGDRGRHQARAQLWSGSPGYMPPEQALTEDVSRLDVRSDVWALGAILYELMALIAPQGSADGRTILPSGGGVFAPLTPITHRARTPFPREIPPDLAAVATRALALDPDDRYPNVLALLADVSAWLDGSRERDRRLARLAHALRLIDHLLIAGASPPPALAALDEAVTTACDALALPPAPAELTRRSAALYWFIFRLLHQGTLPHAAAATLLDRLAARVTPVPEGASADATPWLDALDDVATTAPHVALLATRLRQIAATRIFGGLSGHELWPIAEAVTTHHFAPEERLFSEGDLGDTLWILATGTVRIISQGNEINQVSAPGCFGEIALIDHAPRTADVVAATAVTALALTATRFDALVARHGSIALGVMRLLAERLRHATVHATAPST